MQGGRTSFSGRMPVMSSPSRVTVPSRMVSNPTTAFASVDFPAPFGPRMTVVVPASQWTPTLSSTGGPSYPAVIPTAVKSGIQAPVVGCCVNERPPTPRYAAMTSSC